jgi:hypothetical protein
MDYFLTTLCMTVEISDERNATWDLLRTLFPSFGIGNCTKLTQGRYKVEMLWFILWAINKLNDRATTSQPRKGEGDWHTIIYGEKIQVVLM